jgi:hypothetical protein
LFELSRSIILSILLSRIFDISLSLMCPFGTIRFVLLSEGGGLIFMFSDPARLSAVLSVLACDVDFDSGPSSMSIKDSEKKERKWEKGKNDKKMRNIKFFRNEK